MYFVGSLPKLAPVLLLPVLRESNCTGTNEACIRGAGKLARGNQEDSV